VELDSVDVRADIGVDYEPDKNLTDDYRCFLVDPCVTQNKMGTGYRVTPGNWRPQAVAEPGPEEKSRWVAAEHKTDRGSVEGGGQVQRGRGGLRTGAARAVRQAGGSAM
jgi:hypothetical protein